MREERIPDSGMRGSHTAQGEEEHEVDVGGQIAGGELHCIPFSKVKVGMKVKVNSMK